MHCLIYKSPKRDETYLYLAEDHSLEDLPAALLSRFGPPVFVMELDLHPERRLARRNTAEVLKALAEQGWYLQMPPRLPV